MIRDRLSAGLTEPVSGEVVVQGSVDVTKIPPVTLSGPITIAGTVPVEIVGGISQFLVDDQATEGALGGPTILP